MLKATWQIRDDHAEDEPKPHGAVRTGTVAGTASLRNKGRNAIYRSISPVEEVLLRQYLWEVMMRVPKALVMMRVSKVMARKKFRKAMASRKD